MGRGMFALSRHSLKDVSSSKKLFATDWLELMSKVAEICAEWIFMRDQMLRFNIDLHILLRTSYSTYYCLKFFSGVIELPDGKRRVRENVSPFIE